MKKSMKPVLCAAVCIVAVWLVLNGGTGIFTEKKETNIILLPSLPKPIAKEYALITSAGQSTDAYIINDITNKMMIHNYFAPQAVKQDLDGVSTVVFVPGYSALGMKLHKTTFDKEKARITQLLETAKENKLTVITVYVGGRQRRDKQTDEFLRMLCNRSDYLIATEDADYDGFLSELARDRRMPVTLASGVQDIEEPYASAFR